MTKQVKIVLLLAVLSGYSCLLQAQVSHYLGWWGQAGEYSFVPKYEKSPSTLDVKSSLGAAGGLGFMYELRAGKHFLLDVGLGASTGLTRFKMPDMEFILYDKLDSEGDALNLVYNVDKRKDMYWNTSLQVPLLVGGQWGKFYFLAGAKFDMALYTQSTVKSLMSVKPEYMVYFPMDENPTKGYVKNVPRRTQEKKSFYPTVTASVELGMRLGPVYKETGYDVPKQKIQYRIGFFADYGVLDIHRVGTEPLLKVPDFGKVYPNEAAGFDPFKDIVTTDVMSSDMMKTAKAAFYPLTLGVKFTMLFQLPEKKSCVICREEPVRSLHGIME